MAINTWSRTWRCVLLHFLVLLATGIHARGIPQDVSNSDLQAGNTTSQVIFQDLGLPNGVEKVQSNFDQAVLKGQAHLNMLTCNQVTQSPFTGPMDLYLNGWVTPPPSLTEALPADVIPAYNALFIASVSAVNPMYTYRQSLSGASYGPTMAYYQNQMNPISGMLLSLNNYGSAYMIGLPDQTTNRGPIPPLNRLSDVLWLQWQAAVQSAGTDIGNIRYFYQHIVADDESQKIMDVVQKVPGQSLKNWPGITYSMTGAGDNGRIARAFLGSHNGNAVAFFLAQQREQIGGKKTVSRVQFFGDPEIVMTDGPDKGYQYYRHLLFYVEDVVANGAGAGAGAGAGDGGGSGDVVADAV